MEKPSLLVAFQQENAARVLVHHLQHENTDAQYWFNTEQNAHCVLLKNPEQLEKARRLCEEFLHSKDFGKYQDMAWQSGSVSKLTQSSAAFNGFSIKDIKSAPFTSMVLTICILVYLLSIMGGFQWVMESLTIQPVQQLTTTHQWWRLFTPAFVHFSEIHIIFNVLWWWVFGKQIEQKFGSGYLILFFIATSLLSNYAQLYVSGSNFGGLSGVVYGVIGFVWWIGWLAPQFKLAIPKAMVGFALIWLALGYADLLWVSMANTAHTVGLVVGCSMAWLLVRAYVKQDPKNRPYPP